MAFKRLNKGIYYISVCNVSSFNLLVFSGEKRIVNKE